MTLPLNFKFYPFEQKPLLTLNQYIIFNLINKLFSLVPLATLRNWHLKKKKKKNFPRYRKTKVTVSLTTEIIKGNKLVSSH